MTFDPFGDRDTRGYLRNRLGTSDPTLIAQLEAHSFAANVLPALHALKAAPSVDYDQMLDTHRRLFGSVYPWAGQDRATLAPNIAISKAGVSDLFAHPADVRRAAEYGLGMGLDARHMRTKPGEVFGALAYAHPFLDANGRTIMVVHADLTRRAGFHIDWSQIAKPEFLTALTTERRKPGSALDALLLPHVQLGPMPTERAAANLARNSALNRLGSSPSP
ncbi:Fic family protein [Roseomonas mucosa]|uniref:Fic/DOC family protein n=1 Tax=Roseomonas mucosa TaxID=207340 RepID=UPI0028CF62FB|nr:Fic family protein [Roseomonas mucosa]MDT8278730.1 Fic family protein [Roseomonas mucosa]